MCGKCLLYNLIGKTIFVFVVKFISQIRLSFLSEKVWLHFSTVPATSPWYAPHFQGREFTSMEPCHEFYCLSDTMHCLHISYPCSLCCLMGCSFKELLYTDWLVEGGRMMFLIEKISPLLLPALWYIWIQSIPTHRPNLGNQCAQGSYGRWTTVLPRRAADRPVQTHSWSGIRWTMPGGAACCWMAPAAVGMKPMCDTPKIPNIVLWMYFFESSLVSLSVFPCLSFPRLITSASSASRTLLMCHLQDAFPQSFLKLG